MTNSGRNTVVVLLVLVLAVVLGAGVVAGQDGTGTYAVEQGDRCEQLNPVVDRDLTVESFYGYTTNYSGEDVEFSANTPIGIEETNDETSSLFLYAGSDGLSLVVLHGEVNGSAGGAASLDFFGLPTGGEWVVRDDPSDVSPDLWNRTTDVGEAVDWSWQDNYTDGGAFHGGLDASFEIVVDASFGEDAELEPITEGSVERWRALSAEDGDSLTEIDLDPEQSVTIRSGSCPA